jgi:tellurite resistance protein
MLVIRTRSGETDVHIILGALGSIVTILWLLHRLAEMGIDLGGLNPWLWQRRRNWRKKYEGNPIFSVDSPMEVTGLLLVATAKIDGEMSVEEKKEILEIFEQEFELSKRDAAGLLISTTHLLGQGDEMRDQLEAVLTPSLEKFTHEQADSAVSLMERVAAISDLSQELKVSFIAEASRVLKKDQQPAGRWQ